MTPLMDELEILNNLHNFRHGMEDKINDNMINYIINHINYLFFNFRNILKNKYENEMFNMRNYFDNQNNILNNEITELRNEVIYLNNKPQRIEYVDSKQETVSEILEVIDMNKELMGDQSYIEIMDKLMIIYNR